MELMYTLKQLDFSRTGELAYPHATVLVQPAQTDALPPPAIKLVIRITNAAAAAGLQAVADEALAEARQLLPPPAAELHLHRLLAQDQEEDRQRGEHNAADLLAAMDAARPQSGG